MIGTSPAHITGMTTKSRSRQPAGVPVGGEFATEAGATTGIHLAPSETAAYDFIGQDALGTDLIAGDTLHKVGQNTWTGAAWTILERRPDGKLAVVSSKSGARRNVDPSGYVLDRPDPEMPNGYFASIHSEQALIELRDQWAPRDPAYAARCQEVIDDLPMRAAGPSYRDRMLALDPSQRREVIDGGQVALYFSLTSPHNRWNHDDALAAATGHARLPDTPLSREAYEAMDDDELRQHHLVWRIRNNADAAALTTEIATARGIA